jgi:hypothetical protein
LYFLSVHPWLLKWSYDHSSSELLVKTTIPQPSDEEDETGVNFGGEGGIGWSVSHPPRLTLRGVTSARGVASGHYILKNFVSIFLCGKARWSSGAIHIVFFCAAAGTVLSIASAA